MFAEEKKKQKKQLLKKGHLQVDGNGQYVLTETGREIVRRRIEALPAGDEFLIELAVLDGHEIAVYAD